MELSEFGRNLEKKFGWDFAPLGAPSSLWDRIKQSLSEYFFPSAHPPKGKVSKKTLEEDARDILTDHWDMTPDEVVAALEKRGHSKEDITEFFGPLGEYWKEKGKQ